MASRFVSVAAIALAGGMAGYFLRTPEQVPPEQEDVLELESSPSVVTAIRGLARLEGSSFYLQRVIDLREKQSKAFGLIQAQDAIILIASGEVTAGVDLSQISESGIQIDEARKQVTVLLPAAKISSSKIDNEKTYVHTRSTDLLAEREVQLESQARRMAEAGFVKAAREAGIIEEAERNVARTVEALIRSLGYERVDVSFDLRGEEKE